MSKADIKKSNIRFIVILIKSHFIKVFFFCDNKNNAAIMIKLDMINVYKNFSVDNINPVNIFNCKIYCTRALKHS